MTDGGRPGAPTGTTTVAAVIGDPVHHSLSPVLHNAAFAASGLDWVYVAFEVAAGHAPDALGAMRTLGLGGLSVTMPHKEAVAAAVDRLTPAAAALGAVNCVARQDGELVGDNTDGGGLVDALRHEEGLDPEGRTVVVLGAGGAARAVIRALADAGARSITVVNRDEGRGRRAVALAGPCGALGVAAAVGDADLVINATPVGMRRATAGSPPDAVPVDPALLGPGQLVVDLIYEPLETVLLARAAARGARVANGVGMLLHQAARAFTTWTGEPAPVDAMRAAVAVRLGPGPG